MRTLNNISLPILENGISLFVCVGSSIVLDSSYSFLHKDISVFGLKFS